MFNKIALYWHEITFDKPSAFILLVIPVLLIAYYLFMYRRLFSTFRLPTLSGVLKTGISFKTILKENLYILRILALVLLVMILARPKSTLKEENISSEGIDIVLVMDISGSMLARDFQPNRLEASKNVASEFIKDRPNDRIGLVVFAGESFTQCPITTDHYVLQDLLKDIKEGMIEDGTAIGMGLATAVNRLKDSQTKSKVVILLTDGINNSGSIDPITATDLATQFGIRVYTIGVGTIGMAPYPFQYGNRVVYQDVEVKIDEKLLQEIASATGGEYYRATDNESLKRIYEEIDTLEKSKVKVASIQRNKQEFFPLAAIALVLLGIELLLRYTLTRSIP